MKSKQKLGLGIKKKRKTIGLNSVFRKARIAIEQSKSKDLDSAANVAMSALKGVRKSQPKSGIIPIPKSGGFLPLIPIFAALSALGALAGGASQIASAVHKAKSAQQQLKESERHNRQMEAIAIGKGLYLRPSKKGLGLYLRPYKKNLP